MRDVTSSPRRALVLGSGGHTGIAWEIGIIQGLLESGVDVRDADLLIGSSAGSVVASHLALDRDIEEAIEQLDAPEVAATAATMGARVLVRYAAAGLRPGSPARSRAWLTRRAARSAVLDEDTFVAAVGHGLGEAGWPERDLMITAVRADTGEGVAFTKDSGVPLARAVAASCAVPLIYPPVTIHGDPYVDGGIRTLTNADMAAGADRSSLLTPSRCAVNRPRRNWPDWVPTSARRAWSPTRTRSARSDVTCSIRPGSTRPAGPDWCRGGGSPIGSRRCGRRRSRRVRPGTSPTATGPVR